MQDFARPKEAGASAGTAARAGRKSGSDSPNAPSPPTRSHSRRLRPSHSRAPLS